MYKTIIFACLLTISLVTSAEEIITLATRDQVTQSYLLARNPQVTPNLIVLLFPGGQGNMKLRMQNGEIAFAYRGNFLVRSRQHFVDKGVVTAVLDAPADQQQGMQDQFRMSSEHAQDITIVVNDLKTRFPNLPIYLIGTSRGTISAAYLARALGKKINGVILSSSVYLSHQRAGPGLSEFNFSSLNIPLLLVHHRNDGCRSTPYSSAAKLAQTYPLISVDKGLPATSEPCEAMSEHGFFGKEREVIDAIIQWMLGKPYPPEIN